MWELREKMEFVYVGKSENFESLVNEKTEREAIVSSMGMEADGKCVCVQRRIYGK